MTSNSVTYCNYEVKLLKLKANYNTYVEYDEETQIVITR